MNRKRFIKVCGLAGLGATFTLSLSGCSSIHFVHSQVKDRRLKVPLMEFIEIKKDKSWIRPFVVVKAEKLKFPIVVYRLSDSEYHALWMECTHKGCEVNPHPGVLTCPCHGSEYNFTGAVLQGPAEQNLRSFKVIIDDENIYIDLA